MDQKSERLLREFCDTMGRLRKKCHDHLDKELRKEQEKKERAEQRRKS